MTNQEAIEAIKLAQSQVEWDYPMDYAAAFDKAIEALEQEPTLLSSELEKNSKELEKDFGELDCISRADAIQAMQDKAKKLTNEDTINGLCGAVAILFELPSVTPQEPKTMVEIDLGYVIKQKYIEREVLDKIRAEIKALSNANPSYWHSGDMVDRDDVLEILDKYKAEGNDKA